LCLASAALGQNVAVDSSECRILAGDCRTVISITQNKKADIAVANSSASAECDTVLPGGAFLPPAGREIRCGYANTGQTCTIGPLSLTILADVNVAGTEAETTALFNGDSIATQDWVEIIRPDGQVLVKCRMKGTVSESSNTQTSSSVCSQSANGTQSSSSSNTSIVVQQQSSN